MKTFRLLSLLLAVTVFALIACSKKDDEENKDQEQPDEFYFNVTMNGDEYILSQDYSTIDDEGANLNTFLVKKSDTLKGHGFRIYIKDLKNLGEGTRIFDFILISGQGTGYSQWWLYSDTVNITKLDLVNRTVKGTVGDCSVNSFTDPPIEIKNGEFRLHLSDQPW